MYNILSTALKFMINVQKLPNFPINYFFHYRRARIEHFGD
jgi:hypothetical protein